MTESRFDELINLYLDNEIGRSDLGELKHAIKHNLVQRRKFERACQLHQAARKALTAPPAGESNEDRRAGNNSGKGGNRAPFSLKPNAGSLRDSWKSKQSQAQRNAAVDVLAERQEKQGVASKVDLGKVNLESYSGQESLQNKPARNFAFFDSPIGILAAVILGLVGCLGLYLILAATSPMRRGDAGKFSDTSPVIQLDGAYDPKAAEELAAEVKKHKATTVAADPMRERLYQSALTGQTASNETTIDYFSSHADSVSMSSTTGNVGVVTPTSAAASSSADKNNPQGANPESPP